VTSEPRNPVWDGAITTLFTHCQNVYHRMESQARPTGGMLVYEGMLTKLITSELNLSVPYYTSVLKALKRMGCLRQIRRGGGSSPSQWELLREPTRELFLNVQPRKTPKQGKFEQQQGQIDAINARVQVLERALEHVIAEEVDEPGRA
jgi:hypothetical protein